MSKAKAVSTNRVKKSREDWIFDIILYTIGVLLIIITLYPMYFIVIASFSDPAAVSNGQIMFLPKGVNFKGYKQLASYAKLWTGYRNTIAYVIMGTLVTLVVNIPASYALSRKHLYGRRFFTAFYLIPMFFTGGLIPTYLAVQRFHLLDTFWVMVVPFSVVTYYIIVGRTFFNNSIPEDLWEAAQLDGCGYLGFFFKIVLPLSKAVIAVIALWAAVGQWNSYFNALIYIRSESLQPLQIVASKHSGRQSDHECHEYRRCSRRGKADGRPHQIRDHRGFLRADHVYVPVSAEILQSGCYARITKRLILRTGEKYCK